MAAAEEAAVEEAAAEAAAMPGEPENAGTDLPATYSKTRQCFPCFSSLAFAQFTCHFFFSMHHHTFCLLMFKRPSFKHHLYGYESNPDEMSCCRILIISGT